MGIIRTAKERLQAVFGGTPDKGEHEMKYWRARHSAEGTLSNDHFTHFYTAHFGLSFADYEGKRVLDIGCGPRGSLEWADMATERVGLDPLAEQYTKLGTDRHKMTYVASGAERIPFPDGHFDVVCSFNSLDHVDDLDQTIAEIIRVVAPGGRFLLISDLNHEPTACEPVTFSWDIVERFQPALTLIERRDYAKSQKGVYQSIEAGVPYDHSQTNAYGIISAMFVKPSAVS
jgi:ubiquinone/menaquinone biosynthesis C-methylase UbiE